MTRDHGMKMSHASDATVARKDRYRAMSTIHQMRVQYIAPEDRLLLSVIARDGTEVKLWLTRRFVRLLWPNLVRLAESTPEAAAQPTPDARTSVVRFQHEQALAKARFGAAYDSDKVVTQPLGPDPVLITKGAVRRKAAGESNQLALVSTEGKPVTLALDDTLLHSLTRLIRNAAKAGEWDLSLGTLTEDPAEKDKARQAHLLN
ncbi:hypothetical protein [Iodidimonas sp. SYSU 1G8]|uniref:hypothetical protein n=1 Tax=Iodidimonas sp. SYSU 1G8 TaxID=3133967 RepID=UPI0031FEDE36